MIYGGAKIGRNISVSHCVGQRSIWTANNGTEYFDFMIDIFGCYTCERATRFARRLTGDSTITITHVEVETHYYACGIREFLNVAKRTSED